MKRLNDSKFTVVNLGISWKISNCQSVCNVWSSSVFLLTLLRWTSKALWLTCSCRLGGCFVETLRSFGSFCVEACFVFCTRDRGLTFTSAHVLVRADVDGPSSQPTDEEDHISCVSRALVPALTVLPPHVCRRQETGPSPLVRTCSMKWVILKRLHIQAHRFLRFDAFHVRKPRSQKLVIISDETLFSFLSNAC